MSRVDSRAAVTCSLGPLIRGGINDSYLQGAGLILTRGSLSIQGTITPALGTPVEISVAANQGAGGLLQRSLHVLSSFANPFSEVTEVSVGCWLTYKEGDSPTPSITGEASYVTPRGLECLNGLPPSAFTPPIFAQDVFAYCCDKIGLTATMDTLENAYMMDRFDLSSGYVAAIDSLLLSESKCGYVSKANELVVINLDKTPINSHAVGSSELIYLDSINSGELPPGVVIVPYIDKKLQRYDPAEATWDEVTTEEDLVVQQIDYDGGSVTATHKPTVVSRSEYGTGPSLTDQCELFDGGFGDLSDKVVRRINTRSTSLGVASPGYASALLSENQPVDLGRTGDLVTIETISYDEQDRPFLTVTADYEPMFVYAARLSLPWVLNGASINLGSELVLVQETVVETEYAGTSSVPFGAKVDQDVSEPVVFERKTRRTYQASGTTQGGSQGSAEATTESAFSSVSEVLEHINNSTAKILVDVEITSQKRYDPQGEVRPGEADRAVSSSTVDGEGRRIKYAEVAFRGDGQSARVVQYRPPHMPESYMNTGGLPVNLNTKAIALTYGRAQHRLSVGNRLGIYVQAPFSTFNLPPYEAISISAKNYTARYATNGIGFTFDSNGAVSSSDSLFLGGEGIDRTRQLFEADAPWFYLPEGYDYTQLPFADEGQLIPPFEEIVNVAGGIALGVRATSLTSDVVEPKTVELGIAIGVDGTNGTVREIAEVGAAVGIEATSFTGVVGEAAVGVALGINVEPVTQTTKTAPTGIAVGVNIGPVDDVPFILLNFDDDFSDASPNDWTPSEIPASATDYPVIVPAAALPARFGPGCVISGTDSKGMVAYDCTPGQAFGITWTVEFWLQHYLIDFETELFEIQILGFSGPAMNWNIAAKVQNPGESPWILFQEMSNTSMGFYYPAVEGPTSPRLPKDEWVHIAVVAEEVDLGFGNMEQQIRIYQGGLKVAQGQLLKDGSQETTKLGIFGRFFDQQPLSTNKDVPLFMDELRIVVGKAVYTGESFTPPTGAF